MGQIRTARLSRWSLWLLLVGLLGLLTAACYGSGVYPVDFYYEMHYQPVHKFGEPDRLAPNPEAVPISGKELPVALDTAKELQNPLPRTAQVQARAQELYRVNCAMCHGQTGKGDGILQAYFKAANQKLPADYTTDAVKARTDGELFAIITNGLGQMPAFKDLLSYEDRWALVHQIRVFQGK